MVVLRQHSHDKAQYENLALKQADNRREQHVNSYPTFLFSTRLDLNQQQQL